jgi:hypothetical protein
MRAVLVVVALAIVAVATTAYAEPDAGSGSGSDASAAPAAMTKPHHHSHLYAYSHKGSAGLSVRLAEGLRGIATYHDTDYCGTSSTDATTGNAPVCVTRSPVALELEAAYGVAAHLDILAEMKLGLQADFGSSPTVADGPHPFLLSPGIRYFYSEGHASRLFSTAQVVFDFTGYRATTGATLGSDFGLRNVNGIWFDLHQSYGLYLFFGETLTAARWLGFEAEAGVGFQVRYP